MGGPALPARELLRANSFNARLTVWKPGPVSDFLEEAESLWQEIAKKVPRADLESYLSPTARSQLQALESPQKGRQRIDCLRSLATQRWKLTTTRLSTTFGEQILHQQRFLRALNTFSIQSFPTLSFEDALKYLEDARIDNKHGKLLLWKSTDVKRAMKQFEADQTCQGMTLPSPSLTPRPRYLNTSKECQSTTSKKPSVRTPATLPAPPAFPKNTASSGNRRPTRKRAASLLPQAASNNAASSDKRRRLRSATAKEIRTEANEEEDNEEENDEEEDNEEEDKEDEEEEQVEVEESEEEGGGEEEKKGAYEGEQEGRQEGRQEGSQEGSQVGEEERRQAEKGAEDKEDQEECEDIGKGERKEGENNKRDGEREEEEDVVEDDEEGVNLVQTEDDSGRSRRADLIHHTEPEHSQMSLDDEPASNIGIDDSSPQNTLGPTEKQHVERLANDSASSFVQSLRQTRMELDQQHLIGFRSLSAKADVKLTQLQARINSGESQLIRVRDAADAMEQAQSQHNSRASALGRILRDYRSRRDVVRRWLSDAVNDGSREAEEAAGGDMSMDYGGPLSHSSNSDPSTSSDDQLCKAFAIALDQKITKLESNLRSHKRITMDATSRIKEYADLRSQLGKTVQDYLRIRVYRNDLHDYISQLESRDTVEA